MSTVRELIVGAIVTFGFVYAMGYIYEARLEYQAYYAPLQGDN